MAINLTDNIRVGMQKPVDSRYFDVANSGLAPWQSLAAVKNQTTGVPTALRFRGLTVNILGVEYWWKDGITDADLVIKSFGTTLTLGTIGSTPNADGATLISGELKLQPASGTQGGVVTALNQTFGGAKTFVEDLKVNSLTIGKGGAVPNTAVNNTAVGFDALKVNTANNNTAVGHDALLSNVGGFQNTAIGTNALRANIGGPSSVDPTIPYIGVYNTAVGFEALKLNISNNNTAVGIGTLSSNTTGFQNTAIGSEALKANVLGEENTAVGKDALKSNIDQNWNTAVGSSALEMNSSGFQNTAVGRFTSRLNVSGSYNTAIGVDALTTNLSSNYNTALGYKAGYTVTGNQNTFIGAQDNVVTSLQLATAINSIAIGYNAYTTKNNQIVIGNPNINETVLYGGTVLVSGATRNETDKLIVNGSITSTGYRIPSGQSTWFLKANGTYDTNAYSLDSGVVHKAGTENITGLKTFTDTIKISSTKQIQFDDGTTFGTGLIASNNVIFQFNASNTDGYIFKNSAGASLLTMTQTGNATFLGSATATGFFNSSDARLKDVIERDGDTVKFTWKDKRDDKIHIGYIAQEVQEKYPDQVNEGTDGLLTVNYIEVLVAKIQELENRIKQLEK